MFYITLEKILKDAIVRHKYMKGHKVSFIPGWDCHGLPIELEALKSDHQKSAKTTNVKDLTSLEIRKKGRKLLNMF